MPAEIWAANSRDTQMRTLQRTTLLFLLTCVGFAQAQTGTLRGKVTDPTGAVIPQADVTVTSSTGKQAAAITDGGGSFEMHGIAPGSYTVTVSAKGFARFQKDGIAVAAGQAQVLNFALEIQAQEEKVEVQDQGTNLDVSSSSRFVPWS